MALKDEIVREGIAGSAASAIAGSVANSLTGNLAVQATATVAPAAINNFTTITDTTAAAVKLRADMKAGDKVFIRNSGAGTLLLFPPLGGTINGGSANASVSVLTGASTTVYALDGGTSATPNALTFITA